MAGMGSAASPSTPSIRSWRTAFLTLRDETLTTPTRTSVTQMLHNLIFSHSHTLISAVTELPSHEVLSDILFIMELAATTSGEENMVDTVTQTSRMIRDISRRVTLEINSSYLAHVLECFGKMLDVFLGKAATCNELTGIRTTARVIPAIECLQAVRCITSFHGRYLQSGDLLLVEFLLNIIVSSHSTCKDQSLTETGKKLSMDSSSWELQEVAYSMLGEAISRAGSSFPIHIWRSMIEVVRKTMDSLASKSPILEGNVMSRFYESVLHCLHLILTDSKCSVSDHVSVFVAVLRMFFTYGLTSRTPHTLLIDRGQKELNTRSPTASWEHANKSDHGPYRPPHLRKKDCSNFELHGAWHSQHISDSESSTANSISSDSDLSDSDGSIKDSTSLLTSRVRVAAIICIQDLCQADYKSFSLQWSLLLPTSDVLQPRMSDATLMTCLLFDPYLKARLASATALSTMLDGPSSIFMQVAEYKESSKCGSFTALSTSFGQILLQLHRGIIYLIQQEAHSRLLALLFKILRLIISSTPYSRMPPDLLPMVISSLRRRIEEGFQFKSDQTVLLAAAVGCLTSALSTSPSSAHVRKMLSEELSAGFVEAERKSGVLCILFEYSRNWSCPTLCLEALQALRAAFHNYPNIVIACWEQVSAAVYAFLTVVFPETPSRKPCEYVGSSSTFIEEKVLTAAIRVLDECLRVVSGFQGTEDISDDKFLDVPLASDCIRIKKVSSAPSYEPESDIVSTKTYESGIRQWFETTEKHMPRIMWHSSAMVRAASVTCFAGMTSAVFVSFTKEKQDFIISSLIDVAINDDVPSVRSAACRAIGVISCFPQVCQSAEILDRFTRAVEINTHDSLLSVRITASWALANICDAMRHCVNNLPLGCTGSSANPLMVIWLSECALHLTKDGDKYIPNGAAYKIEKIVREFPWSGVAEKKVDCFVNWRLCCRSREKGGLGLGNFAAEKISLTSELLWWFSFETNFPWDMVIRNSYGLDQNGCGC
ncbi:hypothetical protein L6164_019306 [Bauhinia variegata]|uniref:Uncharacterized protein n=1 Tax=Bauhinia variegata TaxID=167791 RepID=A0ACB9MTF0_BAUVA|nr:hypothetical protein L6164_019306 [Bauhinia variegata]